MENYATNWTFFLSQYRGRLAVMDLEGHELFAIDLIENGCEEVLDMSRKEVYDWLVENYEEEIQAHLREVGEND